KSLISLDRLASVPNARIEEIVVIGAETVVVIAVPAVDVMATRDVAAAVVVAKQQDVGFFVREIAPSQRSSPLQAAIP
ncbi:MAG: hypothetical protein ACKPEY_14165, partial [Planctomycetota bacterium]